MLGLETTQVRAPAALKPGRHEISVRFRYDGGGPGKGGEADLVVDGVQAGQARIERTIPRTVSLSETFDVGSDTGTPVSEDYQVPFAFKGDLIKLEVRPR